MVGPEDWSRLMVIERAAGTALNGGMDGAQG
jgi:hypothetical protein